MRGRDLRANERPSKKLHSMAQTDTQTHGHGDSMTNSAQWGRVGENACSWESFLDLVDKFSNVLIQCSRACYLSYPCQRYTHFTSCSILIERTLHCTVHYVFNTAQF